jgi:beta-glucosidase
MTSPRLTRRALLGGAAGSLALLAAGCDDAPSPAPGPSLTTPPLGLTFPAGFAWGAATSAYQIEGAAAEDGRGPSVWDTFSHTPGRVRNGDTGDVAADHYHKMPGDLDLMKGLGLDSYRFSISWSRILPEGVGTVNAKGVDFYRRLVDGLESRGIAAVATLFHWDLPQALQERGGWLNRDSAEWFAEYAAVMFEALGASVRTWLTLNEPKTVVEVGYRYGFHAPGVRDDRQAYLARHHLLLAHGRAVQAFRASGVRSRIGPALNLAPAYPGDETEGAKRAAVLADGHENRVYLDPVLRGTYPEDVVAALGDEWPTAAVRDGDLGVIGSKIDVLAIQYYNPVYVLAGGRYTEKHPTSDASWQQIYPQGLYDSLTRLRRDYGDPPIIITENGRPCADEIGPDGAVRDPERITFLRDHLAAAHRAIAEGVRLEAYHLWSLMDNFEWAEGYGQRWGIVYVDYPTQRRILKSSAHWYRDVIARNGI